MSAAAGTSAGTSPFVYAVLRVVPRVERGEFVNVGVLLYCQDHDFLAARTELDEARLLALSPTLDLTTLRLAVDALVRACGEPRGSARENLGLAHVFGRLSAPRSTVLQPSAVHAGVTHDPEHALTALFDRLVAPVRS